ncbi:DUF2806 domain-containing protein [Enterobacter roggenkampii]|uniref:DUF2806 domain-containing protein n=1 Tax=Enterobacter roggenkampii TaxID=1812935 RepID=UPI002A837B88|nr:DUF2806 domain-containing protein [Enterobacter roggenkampii]
MDESDESLVTVVTDAVSGVPKELRKPFYKACADLLGGLVAVPAAKLEQFAQSIKDTTNGRSLAANALAKVVAQNACDDPDMVAIAAELYLPAGLRKVRNKIEVAKRAAAHLPTIFPDDSLDKALPPEDDWMNKFMRFSEDASSERLRDLFGRILAGQIKKPKSFSASTLRTLSELDQDIAEDFLFAWSLSVGESVDYDGVWQLGVGFERWKRLTEAGLMAATNTSRFLPPFKPLIEGASLWMPVSVDGISLLVHYIEDSQAKWNHIDFTRVGREIGSILDKPDYEKNIRAMGNRLPQKGLTKIYLCKEGLPQELIWKLR